ncbi:MAG TPA: hypothetical protein VMZ73_10000, partial [Acidimicrobiales bacterium]|nr:hypothetical protein [Acidimicrobiales bacterium]
GSATVRRFAFVAALLLLTPAWCQSSLASAPVDVSGHVLAGLSRGDAGPLPAIRRHDNGGMWSARARPEQSRKLFALGLLALLSLIRLVPWATVEAVLLAPSPLGRRRHVISLRAPPPVCV